MGKENFEMNQIGNNLENGPKIGEKRGWTLKDYEKA